jgi:3-hydroxyacyl-[acyl-carrier-protein] dehydratase
MNGFIDQLPHRAPFSFVSEVVSFEAGVLLAAWQVQGNEEFLRGHFPGDPIVPGVLVLEALAQTAGIHLLALEAAMRENDADASGARAPRAGMLVQSEIRFRRPVRPPARIELSARSEGGLGALYRFNVEAREGNAMVASGSLVLALGS